LEFAVIGKATVSLFSYIIQPWHVILHSDAGFWEHNHVRRFCEGINPNHSDDRLWLRRFRIKLYNEIGPLVSSVIQSLPMLRQSRKLHIEGFIR